MTTKCPYCTNHHEGICPMVKAIDYHPNGSIKRVEFKTANDYPQVPPNSYFPAVSANASVPTFDPYKTTNASTVEGQWQDNADNVPQVQG